MKQPEAFGWVYTSPTEPDRECRWCGSGNVVVNGMIVCPACDFLHNWPNGPK